MLKLNQSVVLAALSSFLIASHGAGQSLETGVFSYDDPDRRSMIGSLQGQYLIQDLERDGPGHAKLFRIGVQQRTIRFKDPNSFVVREQMKGVSEDRQTTLSTGADLGMGGTLTVGINASYTKSHLGDSYTYAASLSEWWREETLQTTITLGRSVSEQVSAIIYDTVSRRIMLPENITGNSVNIAVRHLTSPTLITSGDYTYAQRSDRPDGHSFNLEAKRFFPNPHGALVAGGSYFANASGLKTTSLYGLVEALELRSEWHQRLGDSWALSGGYRYYREWTAARHEDDESVTLVTDSPSFALRYRYGHARWIEPANEVYLMSQWYNTNEPRQGTLWGVGGLWRL